MDSPSSKPIAYLIRHGEDELSDSNIHVSRMDVELTAKGREQAKVVAKKLKEFDIKMVYSSPLIRSLETARAFMEPAQERALLPLNRGVLTGTLTSESEDLLDVLMKNPMVKIPYGESRRGCEDRLEEFFKPALEKAEEFTTAFFTHHSVIDILDGLFKGERSRKPTNLVDPGGIVAVYVEDDGYRLDPILNEDGSSFS